MKVDNETQEILDLLEEPIVAYVQDFIKRIGVKIDKNEAENIVSNVGLSITNRKLKTL